MSIEFRIKQNGEKHCYSNWTMNLKSFLTALYSNENPYEALMSLDRNNQLSDDNYTRDKRNGLITYDIDFDRDTITRHEKGRRLFLTANMMSIMICPGCLETAILKSRTAVLLYMATMSISRRI